MLESVLLQLKVGRPPAARIDAAAVWTITESIGV